VHYRIGRVGFVPYVVIDDLVAKDGEFKGLLPIEEVVCGPSAHPSLTEQGLRLVLDKNGYKHVAIKRSRVPLRVMAPASVKV